MNIFSAFKTRVEKRRAYQALRHLDDHLLRDIGLNRSDLHLMMSEKGMAQLRNRRSHD
ncbi:MAG TPA: DUF1127 domain-containing protein [Devosia sp.]|nr:DUF1127 domain-containing protein [Devosia sp.]